MNKLMLLLIITLPCNTSGLITSGSRSDSHFKYLNLRKELNFYKSCSNLTKLWRYIQSDTNLWKLRSVTFTQNTNITGKLFLFNGFFFLTLHTFSFQNFRIISSLFFFNENLNISLEIIWRFKCLVSVFK